MFGRGVVVLVAVALPTAWSARADEVRVRADRGQLPAVEGVLRALDRDVVEIEAEGGVQRLPLAEVRTLRRAGGAAAPRIAGAVEVVGDGGLRLSGDDLLWDGGRTAAVVRGGARIEVPIERIGRLVVRPAADAAATAEPEWLAAVPAEPAADLVAVASSDGFDLVECAITGITDESVGVLLDGERIPVKRTKVLGLVWVRPPRAAEPAPGVRVEIAGGGLAGRTVEYRDGHVLIDGAITVPGSLVDLIDLAAGRTVRLVDLEAEVAASEPFFGGLATIEGLAPFFAPRIVRPADAAAAWLMRPTSSATWRIPAGSRRFRATAVGVGAAGPTAVDVSVRADGGAEWRRRITRGAEIPLELDLDGGRRLTVGVEFVAGGVGFPVRLDDAAFEK